MEGARHNQVEDNLTPNLKYYEIPVTFVRDKGQETRQTSEKNNNPEDVSRFYSDLLGLSSTVDTFPEKKYTWCEVCATNIQSERYEDHLRGTSHLVAKPTFAPTPDPIYLNEKNLGYKMLKDSGWEYEDGLGKDRSGRRHPIPTKLKLDKLGLGHKYKKKYVHEQQDIREAERRKKHDRRKTRKEIVEEHERERRKRMAMIAYMNR
ncbi:hypothetical protein K7432_010219 [Basidiobolus ranarum]|uniref:G-patch domain-containing protein n=1 Tax=Basidiobolus ranarum TaxID=34480 RepID=A0ABR2VVT5_9FUNG